MKGPGSWAPRRRGREGLRHRRQGSWRLPVQKQYATLGRHDEPHDFQEGVSLMLLSQLPAPLRLVQCPVQRAPAGSSLPKPCCLRPVPTMAPGSSCLAGALDAGHLGRLANCWPATRWRPVSIPWGAGRHPPCCCSGRAAFSPELVQELKAQEWDIDLCHLPTCPPWGTRFCW